MSNPDDPVGSTVDDVDGPAVGTDAELDATPDPTTSKPSKRAVWKEWLIVILVAGGFALLIRTFVVEQFKVVGQSMEPTLHSGDRVLVNKLGYRFHDPNRGDVVVLEPQNKTTSEDDLIKRVIGLPGETVTMSGTDCIVMINGAPLTEPYLSEDARTNCKGGMTEPVTVPAGHVLVMGDNRGHSYDGREFGPVTFDEIVGRAFVVLWPKSSWKWL